MSYFEITQQVIFCLTLSKWQLRFSFHLNALTLKSLSWTTILPNFDGGTSMNLVKYIFVGIWNSFFGISIFILLSLLLKEWNSILILGLSYFFSTLQAHFSQRKFVWKSESEYLSELFKFSSFCLLQFLLNSILLVVMNSVMETPREANQILIIFVLTVLFFFINKNGVFNASRRQIQR